ncbi:MAG: hypothetical protein NT075_24925 [Chloroflexi bacterium]|nr:hypothetical protein [Chloroflexota bacterium]
MQAKTLTHQQVIDLVLTLPLDRLRTVYDFALFLKQAQEPFTDIFGETVEEIQADEEQWAQQFSSSREQMRAMAQEAAAEFRAGRTKSMEFTPAGRLAK